MHRRSSGFRWRKHSPYATRTHPRVPRFRCNDCRSVFSQRAFSLRHYRKRPELLRPVAAVALAALLGRLDEPVVFDHFETFEPTQDLPLGVATAVAQILYRISELYMSSNLARQETECLEVLERAYATEKGALCQHLRPLTYANLYLYLAGRALKGPAKRQKVLLASKFLWRSFVYRPRIVMRDGQFAALSLKMVTILAWRVCRGSLGRLRPSGRGGPG